LKRATSDEEVVSAAVPSMAMCPDGGLLLLGSSVFRKVGYMYKQYRRLHGNDTSDDLCWFAASTVMNPKLPQSVVDAALTLDKSKASAEFLNIWREDIADFMPVDLIEACTDWGVTERAPLPGTVLYFAFADAAGGTGKDSFTLAICHLDEKGRIIIDAIRERQPRFVTADVIRDYTTLMQTYRIKTVMSDDYGGGHYADEWRRCGMKFRECPWDKSDIYIDALPFLEAKRVLLLDHPRLRAQAASLERRIVSGHEKIDHPQSASSHDDVVNALFGVTVHADKMARVLSQHRTASASWWSPATGWVEPGKPPQRSGQPPAHYLASYHEPWRPYVSSTGISTRPYDRWSNRG
jgi:hypothetical protein